MTEPTISVACAKRLDALRARYNRREFVHPDPLEFLYEYDDAHDREIVALIASSLAYGSVKAILGSVRRVLDRMGAPAAFLDGAPAEKIYETFAGYRHRVTSGETLALLLVGVKRVRAQYGSLEACFMKGMREDDETVLPALEAFVDEIASAAGACPTHLLAVPRKGSTCKRLFLFLRWLVRRDEVDPGGWDAVPASKLIMPVDRHIRRIGTRLGFTTRRQPDLRMAMDITRAFRTIAPDDPVKYDFALTRLGIRKDTDLEAFLEGITGERAEVA